MPTSTADATGHPASGFTPTDLAALNDLSAAALSGTALDEAAEVLDLLARTHLIQRAGPGRYDLHDLLRAYARELATTLDTEDDRGAALTRHDAPADLRPQPRARADRHRQVHRRDGGLVRASRP